MHVPLEAESHQIFLYYFATKKVLDSMKNKHRGYYEERVNNLVRDYALVKK